MIGGHQSGIRQGKEKQHVSQRYTLVVFFQTFHPGDVIRGQSSVDFLWLRVRVRVRVRVGPIHGLVPSIVKHAIM